jgi:dephospho-CoA kinase
LKTIGLTGGIGSGKSTVSRLLAEKGALVIDADRVGHDVYRPGTEGWAKLVDEFGRELVADDGTIDRKRLGSIVFADRHELDRLNAIVHPLIRAEIRRRIARSRREGFAGPIVVEAAVLIEARWFEIVDEVWVVIAARDAIYARLHRQRGLDRAAVDERLRSQTSDDERRRHAAVVIDNSASQDALRARVDELWSQRLS